MITETSLKPMRRIRRAMLLAYGPAAEAVAGTTMALSRAWLGVEPPLAIEAWRPRSQQPAQSRSFDDLRTGSTSAEPVCAGKLRNGCSDFQPPGGERPLLDGAWAGLVSGARIAALREAGWTLARGDEIQGWVLVDVAADQATAALTTALPTLAEQIWQAWRVHVTWRALVLAEPAQEHLAAAWVAALADTGVEEVALAGPVDAARLCWETPEWQGRVAAALAALLWGEGDLLRAAGLAQAAGRMPAWAIGGAAWASPLEELKVQAALRCARWVAERWLTDGKDLTGLGDLSGLIEVTPGQRRSALEACVPPAPARLTWGNRRPDWHTVRSVAAALQADVDEHTAQTQAAQYEPRGAWLGTQVAAWQAELAEWRWQRLALAGAGPGLRSLALELQALVEQLRAACGQIQDWLEAASQEFERAQAGAQAAQQALAALCAAFPAPTQSGVLAALTNLWRWPGLIWAYLVLLPRAAGRYLDACGRQWQARRNEANMHALRQAYLAMAQITQEHRREVAALIVQVEQIADILAARTAAATPLPEPWRAAQLDRLAAAWLPQVKVSVQDLPWPTDISDGAVAEDVGASCAAADDLLAAISADLAALDGWSAADCLAAALDDAGLSAWLRRQLGAAVPLWPVSTGENAAATWLLTPISAADGAQSSRIETAFQAALGDGSCDGRGRLGRSWADAVLLLTLAPVQLERPASEGPDTE